MAKRKYTKRWLKAEHWYKQLMYEIGRVETVTKHDAKGKAYVESLKVPPAVRARIFADIFKAIVQVQAKRTPPASRTPEESKFNAENAMKALKELTDGSTHEKPRNSSSLDGRGSDIQAIEDSAGYEGGLDGEQGQE